MMALADDQWRRIWDAQQPFKQILQEDLGQFLGTDECCCPDCLGGANNSPSAVARPDRVGLALAIYMGFFGGPDLFEESDSEAIALRARIQHRFLTELGALMPPQWDEGEA